MALPELKIFNPADIDAQIEREKSAQMQNKLAELAYGQKKQEIDQSNALNDIYKSSIGANGQVDRAKLLSGAAAGGLGSKIPALQKQFMENDKTQSDLDKTKIETAQKRLDMMGQAFGYVRNNPTVEAAHSTLDYLGGQGVLSADQVAQYKQQVSANPTAVKQLADQAFMSVLKAKDQLPTFQTRNTGGTTDTIAINPVTGKVDVANSVRNTMSPDAIASNAIARENLNLSKQRLDMEKNAAKGQYDSDRGVLVDTRTGVARPVVGPDGAPVGEKDKPLTEGQSKAALFGARMKAANEIMDGLASNGTTSSIPGMRAPLIGGVITSLSSSNQQSLDQAKRDFINATLRRESGAAIASSEFDNAERQYFPQPGDSQAVIAQKKANRDRAMRGILAEVPSAKRNGIVNEINGSSDAGQPTAKAGSLKVGTVDGGYRYKGGNPSDPKSWEKM